VFDQPLNVADTTKHAAIPLCSNLEQWLCWTVHKVRLSVPAETQTPQHLCL